MFTVAPFASGRVRHAAPAARPAAVRCAGWAALVIALSLWGCRPSPQAVAASDPPVAQPPTPGSAAWYAARTPKAIETLEQGQRWLETLQLDPFALREAGLNGKRQLVALIEAWRWLYEVSDGPRKTGILARIDAVAAPTRQARFHDLAEIDDLTFKQVATSYLRCAWLLDRVGIDTQAYKREIAKVKGRYDRHMAGRGHHQKLAMRGYYRDFGLDFPADALSGPPKGSLIASRRPVQAMSQIDAYHLTHEILAPYDFGDRPDARPFTQADLTYLETVLHLLMLKYIEAKDPDLLAELVLCAVLIDRASLPTVPAAVEVMLAAQNANGSFGHYPRVEAKLGRLADYEVYVHTSLVVFHALVAVWRAAGVELTLR